MELTQAQELVNVPTIDLPRVVIIGGGFAGLKLARNINSKYFQTVLIDQNNYHTFQPLLYQVATAGLEPDSIAYPLRKILKNKKRTHIRMANVLEIQEDTQYVITDIGRLHYDYLVIATGSSTQYFGNKNIEKYSMPMKSLTQSLNLRSAILQNFEKALNQVSLEEKDSLMNFVIVGGGPTGVELAGALAELKNHVLPKDFPDLDIRRMQIHLVEAGPDLLDAMSESSSSNSLKYLRDMDINIWLNTMVLDYDGKEVTTTANTLKTRNLIWAAGVKGNIPAGIDTKHVSKGRLVVQPNGFLKDSERVMAIGDVGLMQTEKYPSGLPMLASVAEQQGKFLSKNLLRHARDKQLKDFEYMDKGTMATVGRNKAVADLGKFKFGGLFAWLLWLFVHLMLLVDFRNRAVVLFNWFWSYVNFDRGTRLIVRKFNRATSESEDESEEKVSNKEGELVEV